MKATLSELKEIKGNFEILIKQLTNQGKAVSHLEMQLDLVNVLITDEVGGRAYEFISLVCLDCGKTVLTLNKDGECNECCQGVEE